LFYLKEGCLLLFYGGVMEEQYKTCSSCGKKEKEDSKFCGRCGKNIDEKESFTKKCVNCKKEIEVENIYCRYCGATQEKKKHFNYSIAGVMLSFIIIGPLCLIPLWMSKYISKNVKILMSVLIVILSIVIIFSIMEMIDKIMGQYQEIMRITM
jgi:uncharacterized membrane protein YvbJ